MQFGLIGAFFDGTSGVYGLLLALVAFILDLLLADPSRLPHPVQAVGKLLTLLERFFRGPDGVQNDAALRRAGRMGLIVCLLVVGGICVSLTALPAIGWLFSLYLAWAGLALGGLRRAGTQARYILQHGSLSEARRAVAMLVSRDTEKMERPDLYRSLAESLSENFNDAFVAPFFWLVIAGPVGLWLYKAVSTMDSMWGYKSPRWVHFGRCAARLDDFLAWIPARLSALFLCLAGRCTPGTRPCPAYKRIRQEARSMESPNGGWPMAVCAWLCGARMGGPTPYHGIMTDKPPLGPQGLWDDCRMHVLTRLLAGAGLLTVFFLCGAACLLLLFL